MSAASDEEIARLLQLQFDSESVETSSTSSFLPKEDSRPPATTGSHQHGHQRKSSGPMGIVDQRWELIDPIPDIRALFLQFNDQFFWGRLEGVEVRWSPRMTLCAGLCCYEGFGGLCSVRLSQPLLKLRPRKDLVETLLHEMIHAYLFVTQNNKDHDGHGPEFCKHMTRINTETGTNISIYHTFHDEVDSYRQHWWRCDGRCRDRKPYFGYVKRSMNRAPSERDTWWGEHQRTCGGTYTKIKEPEGYGKKKGGKKESGGVADGKVSKDDKEKPGKPTADIRNFIAFSGQGQKIGQSSSSSSSQSSKTFGGSTTSANNGRQINSKNDKTTSSGQSSLFGKKVSGTKNSATSVTNKAPASSTNNVNLGNTQPNKSYFQKTTKDDKDDASQSKPRFTPVVATASGPVLNKVSGGFSSDSDRRSTGSESEPSSQRPARKFIPVVAAVGRKGSTSSVLSVDKSSSELRTSRGHKDSGQDKLKKPSGDSSGQNSNKRARLVDLQTIFDSDSDDDHADAKSSKIPRYALDDSDDDDVIATSDGIGNTSFGSDKENRGAADVYIEEDGESESMGTTGRITTGIWKDLSHTHPASSTNIRSESEENRRFGRVPPPLWGKKSSNNRVNRVPTTPQSSFSEHPWQTAARAVGSKSNSAAAVTPGNRIIDLDDENEAGGGGGGVVGPKTVQCPVCHLQIEERKINNHLDTCLTYNCKSLFTP